MLAFRFVAKPIYQPCPPGAGDSSLKTQKHLNLFSYLSWVLIIRYFIIFDLIKSRTKNLSSPVSGVHICAFMKTGAGMGGE